METATAENTCADENETKKRGITCQPYFAMLSFHTHTHTHTHTLPTLPHTLLHTTHCHTLPHTHHHTQTTTIFYTHSHYHTHMARGWDRSAPSPFKEGLPVPPQAKVIFIDKHFAIFEGLFAAVVVVIVFYGRLSRRYEDRLHAKHKPCHHTPQVSIQQRYRNVTVM